MRLRRGDKGHLVRLKEAELWWNVWLLGLCILSGLERNMLARRYCADRLAARFRHSAERGHWCCHLDQDCLVATMPSIRLLGDHMVADLGGMVRTE